MGLGVFQSGEACGWVSWSVWVITKRRSHRRLDDPRRNFDVQGRVGDVSFEDKCRTSGGGRTYRRSFGRDYGVMSRKKKILGFLVTTEKLLGTSIT